MNIKWRLKMKNKENKVILKKFKEICRIIFSINKDCKSVSLFTIFKDKYEGKNILRNGGLTLTRKCQLK